KVAQAQELARVALTYVDSDYGAGMQDTFRDNYENFGGTITSAQVHESNKDSYLAQLDGLNRFDPQALVVIAWASSGGATIVKEALGNGLFKLFLGTYTMMEPGLIEEVGADKLNGSSFVAPSFNSRSSAAQKLAKLYGDAFKADITHGLFIARTYDAVMLMALAVEQAGSTDRTKIRDALRQICCAP